ncbi:MAG: hypothetical protein LBT83_07955 [Tannerella sp.]|jgi:hypothetical protein|nr:hypothetical protein [Tannerella sp.]
MAKNKKRKKVSSPHVKPLSVWDSKSHFDYCCAMARKFFQALGEAPESFDTFTKRQKQSLFRVEMALPRISAAPGHAVPRQYIRYIQSSLIYALRAEHFDKSLGLTWMDMVICGHTLMLTFRTQNFLLNLPEKQREIVDRMNVVIEKKQLLIEVYNCVMAHVKTTLMLLSQPNFRIYGLHTDIKLVTSGKGVAFVVLISSQEGQSLKFKYRNRERTGYRVATGKFMDTEYVGATIAFNKIYPSVKQDRTLNIYVQSHALHRFKERIDTLHPILRNQVLLMSLMYVQRTVTGTSGSQLIACVVPTEQNIGYFTFTIDGNNLLVLTLLPLLSPDVPEGRILCERLNLSKTDLQYLGMDKLSFFYDVDLEQIPVLKKILIEELDLGYVKDLYNSYRAESGNEAFDEKKTHFVKHFFRDIEKQSPGHAEILNEIAEAETNRATLIPEILPST